MTENEKIAMSSKCIFRYMIMKTGKKKTLQISLFIMSFFRVFIIIYLKNALLYIIYYNIPVCYIYDVFFLCFHNYVSEKY